MVVVKRVLISDIDNKVDVSTFCSVVVVSKVVDDVVDGSIVVIVDPIVVVVVASSELVIGVGVDVVVITVGRTVAPEKHLSSSTMSQSLTSSSIALKRSPGAQSNGKGFPR